MTVEQLVDALNTFPKHVRVYFEYEGVLLDPKPSQIEDSIIDRDGDLIINLER